MVWHDQKDIDHLIHTLSLLYQIKVNWLGTKYLGMTIDIDRVARHVTLTMPKYIDKLLQRVRPDGVKGARPIMATLEHRRSTLMTLLQQLTNRKSYSKV